MLKDTPAQYSTTSTVGTNTNTVWSCPPHLAETQRRLNPSTTTMLDPPYRYSCKGCADGWPE